MSRSRGMGRGLVCAVGRWSRLSGVVALGLVASLLVALPASAAPARSQAKAPEPSCVDEAPDEGSAKRLAKACAKKVEALSKRTEFSRTFANPSGSMTLEQAIEPQRVKKGDGWVPVDPTLRLVNGRIEPRAAVPSMSFSAGGQGQLARLADKGREIGISWPGNLPTPVLTGNIALYRDVLPGVDLRLTATSTGFSEVLIVRTREAAANPKLAKLKFGLATKDVNVIGTAGGGLVARDGKGEAVFTSSAPLMWDSSERMVDPGKAEPATVTPRPASTRGGARDSSWEQPSVAPTPSARQAEDRNPPGHPSEGAKQAVMPVEVVGSDVVVTPDKTLLEHPDAKYPVYIDPNWNWARGPDWGWTTVWSKYANSNFWGDDTALLNGGTYGAVGAGRVRDCDTCSQYIIRTMFQFPLDGLPGKRIIAAQFQIEQRHAWTCNPGSDAGVFLTGPIDGNTTWNNQPYWNWDYYAAHEGNHKIGAIHGCADVGTLEFNVTHIVGAVVNNGYVTLGMMAFDEGTLWQWKRYNHATALVLVEYNSPPNRPENLTAESKACASGSGRPYVLSTTPTLAASQSDPDTGQQNLTTKFSVWPVGGTPNENVWVGQSSGNPSNVSASVPPGWLADGGSYVWQARTQDPYNDVAYSGTCEFTVDATPPAGVTSVSSAAYPADGQPHGGVGLLGTFAFNPPTLRPYEVVGYAYTLDGAIQPSGATQVTVSPGSGTTVTIAPVRDGVNALRVWTRDQAGRFSSPYTYTFTVRAGSGPAGEWTFSEASGNATDATGHGNTATLNGGASRTTGRGNVGSALALNGSTGYAATSGPVLTPHPDTGAMLPLRTDSSFTATARVYLPATGGTVRRAAISADGTNASAFLLGYSGPDNRWVFSMALADTTTTTSVQVLSDAAPTVNRWTHLAAVYDVSTHQLRLYVNGVAQAATATLSGGFNASGPVNIGRHKAAGAYTGFFNGNIDDARLYNFAETGTKLAELAVPLPPTISFPAGNEANVNGTLSVRFDANGDTNVTSFKYSVFSPTLNLTATPTTPGGTVTVTINVGSVTGDRLVFAASGASATSVSAMTSGTFRVNQSTTVQGTVYDFNGIPVEGAVVTLTPGSLSMTTTSTGAYSFTGFAPGIYTLAAHLGGPCGPSTSVVLEIDQAGAFWDLYLEVYADDYGYTCTDQTATFTPANGTVLALTGDDAVARVNLPFAFPFYGHAYLNAWIDTNGLLTFEDPGGSHAYTGSAGLLDVAAPNAVVAPFWDDLVVDASASVRSAVLGSGSSQQFLIEWRNVYRKANTSQRLTFEAVLSRDGTVTTNYSDLDNTAERGASAAVGIESPGGSDALVYSVNNAALQSGRAITFDHPGEEVPIDVFDLSGTLLNAAGSAVVGATVTLEPRGLSTVTGAGGAWSFTDLVADSYTISSSVGGKCAQAASTVVALIADTVRDLQLAPQYGGMGYACSTGASGYVAASTVLPLTGDGAQLQVSLPFPLKLHGRTYTTAWVGDDGFMSFGSDMTGDYWVNQPMPTATAPNALVAPFWDDLDVDASASVRTQVLGTAPNRSFVVEWRNVRILEGSPSDRITFEVIYGENGQIGFHYGALSTNGQRGATATIGIENADGTLGAQYSHNEDALTSNGSVVFTAAPPGTISGTVTSARLTAPVAGATVTLNPGGTTTTTDANGNYQFTSVGVGEYEVSVVPNNGYCGGQFAVQTVHQAGGTTDVDLTVLGTGDGGGYTCRTGTQAFMPADDGDTHGSGDDYMIGEPLPFPITLYGSTYTYGWIDSNGSVTFQQSDSAWDFSPIPSPPAAARHDAAVYPFWADWVIDSQAEITHKLSGTAPNRTWSVVWHNVMNFHDQSARVTFEVIFEESGAITFTYADIDQGNPTERGATATVGIENGFGTIAFQYLHRQPLLASGTSIRFEPGVVLPGTITGDVTCQGAPVANATVAINGTTTTTQSNGAYTLANVPGGGHTVIATPSGGACGGSHVLPATVGSGATVGLDFDLTSTPAGTGYSVAEQPFTFVPAGNVLALTGDDDVTQVTLPFPVTHYGQTYTTAWVDTNGVVSFIPPNGSAWKTGPIPSAAEPNTSNAAVYPLWDDWVVDGQASVRTATIGTAPNRTFVVEWRNVMAWEDTNTRVSFEVVFAESGGYTFAYTDLSGGFLESGGGSTIGIENADGTVALQFSYLIPSVRPNVGIRFAPPSS